MSYRLLMVGFILLLAALIVFGVYKAFFEPPPSCPTSNPHCGALPPGNPTYRP
jgi:hypothetical protein